MKDKKFPDLHNGLDKYFLQKTGPRLINFSPCEPIYILQARIGGRHPVPYLRTQMTKRKGYSNVLTSTPPNIYIVEKLWIMAFC